MVLEHLDVKQYLHTIRKCSKEMRTRTEIKMSGAKIDLYLFRKDRPDDFNLCKLSKHQIIVKTLGSDFEASGRIWGEFKDILIQQQEQEISRDSQNIKIIDYNR